MSWFVYLVECVDGSLYCGVARDVERRLAQHNGELPGGARYTRSRRPVRLAGVAGFPDRASACSMEYAVKKLPRHKKLAALAEVAPVEDKPFLLKNVYDETFVESLGRALAGVETDFDAQGFRDAVLDAEWEARELKQRMRHLTRCLREFLPREYGRALAALTRVAQDFGDLPGLVFPDFVEQYGLGEFEESVKALEYFTCFSSSEFAVRPFIRQYGERMMERMAEWAESDNHHLRRLASEGCRPRLPWGSALGRFKKDPGPPLRIIKKLLRDPSEYVRRSVANNLNDISKDHPELVADLAREHMGKHPDTDRLLKHACRTMLKKGEPRVLELFGFPAPEHVRLRDFQAPGDVAMGGELEFSFVLESPGRALGRLRLEYAVDFNKANGSLSRKVFMISERDHEEHNKTISKKHRFKDMTTRKHHPGPHRLAILANGRELFLHSFELTP